VRFRTEGENMKYQYKEMPESMKGTYGEFSKNFGFDWKEFIMGIPTPMFLVTTYKSNGQPMLRCSHGQGLRVRTMAADIT
jgi:hypothetical protein